MEKSTLIQHEHGLGEKVTTPAGSGYVTAIILELGGGTLYRVRVWGEEGLPIEIELYPEELS